MLHPPPLRLRTVTCMVAGFGASETQFNTVKYADALAGGGAYQLNR